MRSQDSNVNESPELDAAFIIGAQRDMNCFRKIGMKKIEDDLLIGERFAIFSKLIEQEIITAKKDGKELPPAPDGMKDWLLGNDV